MIKLEIPKIEPLPVSSLTDIPEAMTDSDFNKVSSFIEKQVGIKMPASKKLMIQSRLTARLKALDMHSYKEYLNYAFSSAQTENDEITSMIDVLTTNLTNFFREKEHFNVMMQTVLPTLSAKGITNPCLWSAGCSTGEEPYTLSMVMQEYMRLRPGKFTDYEILATDISTRVLEKAAQAVYPIETIEKLSYDLKHRYFLKSRPETGKPRVRVNEKTREKVRFSRLNFMDHTYNVFGPKDIIFCRNVLIYFDKQTQQEVIAKLLKNLNKGGFLFLGHSETIFGMDLPVETIAPTVFHKLKD